MTDHTWHAGPHLLSRYHGGDLNPAAAASVEAHLMRCPDCRAQLADQVTTVQGPRLEALWADIVEAADAPPPGLLERALRRAGMADHAARLLAATPSLQASWLLAVAATLGFVVLAARGGDGTTGLFVYLAVAPLLPVAGTAAAFGPRVDPAYEIAVAAPLHGFRLLLIRSAAVLASTLVLSGLAAAALPHAGIEVAAWVLPALALTTGTLLLATRWEPVVAAAALGAAWVAVMLAGAAGARPGQLASPEQLVRHVAAFGPTAQALFALFTAVAVVLLLRRRDTLELGRLA